MAAKQKANMTRQTEGELAKFTWKNRKALLEALYLAYKWDHSLAESMMGDRIYRITKKQAKESAKAMTSAKRFNALRNELLTLSQGERNER